MQFQNQYKLPDLADADVGLLESSDEDMSSEEENEEVSVNLEGILSEMESLGDHNLPDNFNCHAMLQQLKFPNANTEQRNKFNQFLDKLNNEKLLLFVKIVWNHLYQSLKSNVLLRGAKAERKHITSFSADVIQLSTDEELTKQFASVFCSDTIPLNLEDFQFCALTEILYATNRYLLHVVAEERLQRYQFRISN